eukprot:1306412-Pyramimonas_sp.AAC.1
MGRRGQGGCKDPPHGPRKTGLPHGQVHLDRQHPGVHGSPGTSGIISGTHGPTRIGRPRGNGPPPEVKPTTPTS